MQRGRDHFPGSFDVHAVNWVKGDRRLRESENGTGTSGANGSLSVPYRAAKINRNAVGGRLKPKSGLQTRFEPQESSLKVANYLNGQNQPLR